jgi:hypothetical protein
MSDEELRSWMRASALDDAAPLYAAVATAAARRWRVRPVRVSVAAACLLALGIAAFETQPRQAPPQLAELVLPPTTDWLLETPPPDWLARASQQQDEGETDAK